MSSNYNNATPSTVNNNNNNTSADIDNNISLTKSDMISDAELRSRYLQYEEEVKKKLDLVEAQSRRIFERSSEDAMSNLPPIIGPAPPKEPPKPNSPPPPSTNVTPHHSDEHQKKVNDEKKKKKKTQEPLKIIKSYNNEPKNDTKSNLTGTRKRRVSHCAAHSRGKNSMKGAFNRHGKHSKKSRRGRGPHRLSGNDGVTIQQFKDCYQIREIQGWPRSSSSSSSIGDSSFDTTATITNNDLSPILVDDDTKLACVCKIVMKFIGNNKVADAIYVTRQFLSSSTNNKHVGHINNILHSLEDGNISAHMVLLSYVLAGYNTDKVKDMLGGYIMVSVNVW